MSSGKNRREFLTAGMAGRAPDDDRVESGPNEVTNLFAHQRSYLESYKKNAMACEFELLFNLHEYQNAATAAVAVFQLIDELEDQLTVYRSTSEVSYLNEHAFDKSVTVEAGLFELLELAEQIRVVTDGAFDITSWPLTDLWGFSRRQGSVPQSDEIENSLRLVGGTAVKLNEDCQVKFAKDGMKINLGGIGKGFAVDRAVEQIEQQQISNFIIHAGQSSVVARGNCLDSDSSDAWKVGLSHPVHAGQRIAEIQIKDAALGTSGTGRQGFFHQGRRYGHIIDPRTGWPTDHFVSTTVICESAARADALATAFFVMSLQEVQAICRADKSIKAILVQNKSKSNEPEIQAFNLDGDELEIFR